MTVQEFSDQFDVLYNNITSNQAPGLNEYEKSVFLTKAQEEIVKNYFNPKANPKQDGFDDSPKRQADFSTIISYATLSRATTDTFDQNSYTYAFPSDLFISLNEQLTYKDTLITVVPVSFEEYNRVMSKPYKFPPKYQAWRLITKNSNVLLSSSSTVYYTGEAADGDAYYYEFPITLTTGDRFKVTLYIYGNSDPNAAALSAGTVVVAGNNVDGYVVKYRRTSGQSFKAAVTAINADNSFNVLASASTNDDTGHYANNYATVSVSAQGVKGFVTLAEVRGRFDSAPVYRMRYVKRPQPIILINLGDSLKIHDQFGPSECELPEELHEEILQRAVELAKVAWTANGQDNAQMVIQAGQRSE